MSRIHQHTTSTLPILCALLIAPAAVRAQDGETPPEQPAQEPSQTSDGSDGNVGNDNKEGDTEAAEEGRATETLQDESGKKRLSDRIKAVQRKVFLKKNRVEIFPQFALDLNDPFFQHFIVGGAIAYHVADSLALEARGGWAFASLRQGAITFVRQETDSLIKSPPEFKYHFDLDAVWSPLYGKISLFGESILHFDTYITAGGGGFGTDAGLNPAANVGIGQRYFVTDWLVLRFELRDYIFLDNREDRADLQNLLVFGFALSGFLPTSFDYEYQ